ncbi:SPOR domain-containing protein [Sphingorhabdus sp.]|uniref:SPOR domain-containing protein n=1 Tax=Sphingorhabdus sp. TaxID=1902408 RepID=UPI00391BF69D
MNSNFVVKLALSTAFVAVPAMTATAAGAGSTSKEFAKKASPEKAFQWARKAEQALVISKNDRALQFAELAVEAEPQNRDYRALLARVYMAKGRFVSAERTLLDVMELGQVDSRTVISLALSRIAQGNTESALSLIDAHRSIIPVSDYGLTLALAGRSGDAIIILTDAVRTDSASSRTRQNLALAYALDGRWREARVMASQDMSQDNVNQRIAEWAQFARPGAHALRVAGLLKVRPDMSDTGQPVRLALNSPAPVAFAMADVAPATASFESLSPAPAAAELAAVEPPLSSASAGFAAAETTVELAQVPAEPSPKGEAPPIRASVAPAKLALADVPASGAASSGRTHLVQLGAFSSAASAKAAWAKYSAKFGALRGFESTSSTVTVNGRKLTRLAATGFGNAATARSTCQQIKAQGGACFIVPTGATQSVRLAQTGRSKIASR